MMTTRISTDQRRFKRIAIDLGARFLLADGSEHSGRVANISAGGLAVLAARTPAAEASVVLYVEEIGRLEGRVVRLFPGGFACALALPALKREKVVESLMLLLNRDLLLGSDLRRHERVPATGDAQLRLPDGQALPCRLLDLSVSGVSLQVVPPPAIGTDVSVGRMRGRVVRHHDSGCAVEFRELPHLRGSLASQLSSRSGR